MTEIKISVIGQVAYKKNVFYLASDAVNFAKVTATFDETWDGLTKRMQFVSKTRRIDVYYNDNGPNFVPWEFLADKKDFTITFIGDKFDGTTLTTRATTGPVECKIVNSKFSSEADNPGQITPTIIEQIEGIAAEAKTIAQSVEERANNHEFDGLDAYPIVQIRNIGDLTALQAILVSGAYSNEYIYAIAIADFNNYIRGDLIQVTPTATVVLFNMEGNRDRHSGKILNICYSLQDILTLNQDVHGGITKFFLWQGTNNLVVPDTSYTLTKGKIYLLTKVSDEMYTLEDSLTVPIRSISVNGEAQTATNNNIDISVPTDLSQLNEDTEHVTISAVEKTLINTNAENIDSINQKIPSTASEENQLADINFVNSSIATNTAYFRGTFNSYEDLLRYTGIKTNNDYAFVIAHDTAGNTIYDRYKYNGTAWVFEYPLNNSSFTAAQWATINSGMTAADKRKLDAIENNAQANRIERILYAGTYVPITNKTAILGDTIGECLATPHSAEEMYALVPIVRRDYKRLFRWNNDNLTISYNREISDPNPTTITLERNKLYSIEWHSNSPTKRAYYINRIVEGGSDIPQSDLDNWNSKFPAYSDSNLLYTLPIGRYTMFIWVGDEDYEYTYWTASYPSIQATITFQYGTLYYGYHNSQNQFTFDRFSTVYNLDRGKFIQITNVNELSSSVFKELCGIEHIIVLYTGADATYAGTTLHTNELFNMYFQSDILRLTSIGSLGGAVDQTYQPQSEKAQSGTAVAQAMRYKVDKVEGKGLSTNDFDLQAKSALANTFSFIRDLSALGSLWGDPYTGSDHTFVWLGDTTTWTYYQPHSMVSHSVTLKHNELWRVRAWLVPMVGARFDEVTKIGMFEEIPTQLADLAADDEHNTVSLAQIADWNDKLFAFNDTDDFKRLSGESERFFIWNTDETEFTYTGTDGIERTTTFDFGEFWTGIYYSATERYYFQKIGTLYDIMSVDNKVDKVPGKGLSTNDYTDAAKAKVDNIPLNPKYTDTVYDDTELRGKIATVESKIPSQATSTNQLADKEFVNSSINNIAAFPITKDAAGNPFATKAELDAATVFYSGGEVRVPTRNDYTVVLSDESHTDPVTGNTPATRYYYYNGWNYQYPINNTGFTAAQWAAINSGITAALVASIGNKVDRVPGYNLSQNNYSSGDMEKVGKIFCIFDSVMSIEIIMHEGSYPFLWLGANGTEFTYTDYMTGNTMTITFNYGEFFAMNVWGQMLGAKKHTFAKVSMKLDIPTTLADLTDDSTHRVVTDDQIDDWDNKVDTVAGKNLSTNDFTNTYKSMLDELGNMTTDDIDDIWDEVMI